MNSGDKRLLTAGLYGFAAGLLVFYALGVVAGPFTGTYADGFWNGMLLTSIALAAVYHVVPGDPEEVLG